MNKYILLPLIVFTFYIIPARAENRVALVIGNAAYDNSPLNNPVNDAESMAEILAEMGFTVLKGIDLNQNQMQEKIQAFKQLIQSADIGLFYFAGHAVQYQGENYLFPLKTDIQGVDEIKAKAINTAAILNQMEKSATRVNMMILDACRNIPIPKIRGFDSISQGLIETKAPKGSLIAYATAPGKVSMDGRGKHGLYTESLMKFIQEPIPLETIFKKVRDEVSSKTNNKQIPWEHSSLIGRDFYFVQKPQTALSIDLNYVYRAGGKGKLLAIKPQSVLHSGDTYKAIFTPNNAAYVYIFQVDSRNKIDQLFPVAESQNPVVANITYTIPSKNHSFSLDHHIGKERFYFVMSKKPNIEVENLYQSLKNHQSNKNNAAISSSNQKLNNYLIDRGLDHIVIDQIKSPVYWDNNQVFSLMKQKLKGICQNCVSVLAFEHQ